MNLTTKISNRSLVLLWELSLLLHAPVFKWMKLRQIFLKRRSLKHLYGRDILTISFLFGRMEKRNLKSLWRNLKTFFAEPSIYIRVIEKRVTFVDLNVSLENGSVTTDLHTKNTDCPQYLHCSSSHPDHIKNSIIYSQTLRLSNICTYEEDFDKHALNMKSCFLERDTRNG